MLINFTVYCIDKFIPESSGRNIKLDYTSPNAPDIYFISLSSTDKGTSGKIMPILRVQGYRR